MQRDSSTSAVRPAPRLHHAARAEDALNRIVSRWLRRRGWRPRVLPYTGYGTNGHLRVLARVLLAPPRSGQRDLEGGRGWRRFFAITAPGVPVVVEACGQRHVVTSARGGYIDTVVDVDLNPGWASIDLSAENSPPCKAAIRVVGTHEDFGIISDIDDTVMITALPRPLLAFWNTFVRREAHRRPVHGIADLYRAAATSDGEPLVVYLSTGAWNVAPAVEQFLARQGLPRGPLLLTDWGPTPESWFRSGREHKRAQLQRLLADLPQVRWLLVGDDGQHDPQLYCELATASPGKVRAIAIRQLTPTEQVLTHGTPEPLARQGKPLNTPPTVEEVRGPDGFALLVSLRERGILPTAELPAKRN